MNRTRQLLLGVWTVFSIVAILATGAVAQSPRPSQRLHQEVSAATDLRAFAMNAMTRPQEGGVFYAKYIVNICGRDFDVIVNGGNAAVSKEIATTGTVPSYKLKMVSDLRERCAPFVAGETLAIASDLKGREAAGTDPLIVAERELIRAAKSGRPEMLRAAVARAMQLDDPLLWTHRRLYDYVTQADAEARKVLGFYLGGKVYAPEDVYNYFEAHTALELGFCKPDEFCALDHEVSLACAAGGHCAPDRYEKAKQILLANGGTEDGWHRVLALTAQIQNALEKRNVAFFVR